MAQHFLLSARARTLSIGKVQHMTETQVETAFAAIRWADTNGKPVCPHCGCTIVYEARRPNGALRFRCKACRKDFSLTSGTLFAFHKMPLRTYLAAIVIFCNEVKGKSALALSRDLDCQYKTAFVLGHKLREAMASEVKGYKLGGQGKVVEVDGGYFGGYVKPANFKDNRRDRRLAKNQNGKRQVVVVIRQRDGMVLPSAFKTEGSALAYIRNHVAAGTEINADEATSWDALHGHYVVKRINHQLSYSDGFACTNDPRDRSAVIATPRAGSRVFPGMVEWQFKARAPTPQEAVVLDQATKRSASCGPIYDKGQPLTNRAWDEKNFSTRKFIRSGMLARDREEINNDDAMVARAAWLYHAGALTQAEVARSLGVTAIKAHRLLARARREGVVRIVIEGAIGGCIELERTLCARFGLAACRVVPLVGEIGLPLRALGQAGAAYISSVLDGRENAVVGVGHGRSLEACMQYLPRVEAPGLRLVSLLGGLPRLRTASPYEMIQAFAKRTEAEAWLMPVPFFANSAAERAVLVAQRGVAEAFALAREAQLCFVGIGDLSEGAFLRLSDAIDADDLAALHEAGAVGEVLGRFFDADGRIVPADLHQRVIAPPLHDLPGLTAIAGGSGKEAAIAAVLRSGLLAGLITDEATAQKLASTTTNDNEGENTCRKRNWTRPSSTSPAGSDVAT